MDKETKPLGRPTTYDPIYISKVDEYLAIKQDEDYQVTTFAGTNGDKVENKLRVKLPTVEGFALFIGCNKTSLYEWEKIHPDFSNALDKIRQEQKERLLDKGLSGDYNSTIAKLILSSNHGMREKSETDITSKGQAIGITGINYIKPDGTDNSPY